MVKSTDLINQTIDLAHLPPGQARDLLIAVFASIATALKSGSAIDLDDLTGGRIAFDLSHGTGLSDETETPAEAEQSLDNNFGSSGGQGSAQSRGHGSAQGSAHGSGTGPND